MDENKYYDNDYAVFASFNFYLMYSVVIDLVGVKEKKEKKIWKKYFVAFLWFSKLIGMKTKFWRDPPIATVGRVDFLKSIVKWSKVLDILSAIETISVAFC